MDIQTYSDLSERTYLPTTISYLVFMSFTVLCVGLASYLVSKGRQNIFTQTFAYQAPWSKMTQVKRSEKAIKCIDGIRALSMMWVVAGHLYMGGIRLGFSVCCKLSS